RAVCYLTHCNGLHWTAGSMQVVNAIDVVAPTGRYDSSRLVSPGRHAWVVRPGHMATWLSDRWDFSYRIHYDHEFENRDTGYRSGDTVYLNYALGWRAAPETTIGPVGYALAQVNDDRGTAADGHRLRVSGI